ncbi:MAG: leucine-rich repeat domain-containing protein [Pirellulales bacterium]|nr:leucine-rich repeat domain-containing protein [Pirellulales bacterium]
MGTENETPPSSTATSAPATVSALRPSRRWLQFRLRTLLVLLTLFGLTFGLVFAASRRQREAEMRAITVLGATGYASSSHDAYYPPLSSKPAEKKAGETPDRVLASVDIPQWLKSVPGVAADGIFGRVFRLDIGHHDKISRFTPEEKSSLGVLHSLWSLSIDGFILDRDDVERLATPSRLTHLFLTGCTFDPGAFEPMGQLKHLYWLDLNGSSVKDDDLQTLAGLRNLQVLNLSHTEITDQGLEHLHQLPSLRRLELSGSRVTDEGIDRLRETLPNMQLLDD